MKQRKTKYMPVTNLDSSARPLLAMVLAVVPSRTAAKPVAEELVKVNQVKRDRRTIEEIQKVRLLALPMKPVPNLLPERYPTPGPKI